MISQEELKLREELRERLHISERMPSLGNQPIGHVSNVQIIMDWNSEKQDITKRTV